MPITFMALASGALISPLTLSLGTVAFLCHIECSALTAVVNSSQKGTHYVSFPDGGLVTYELPHTILRGILWGERIMEVRIPLSAAFALC